MSIYLKLFLSFLQIGALSFGGGYAAMPLLKAQVIDIHGWMTMADFTDLVTIAEMTPGPIAVNAATFVGNQVAKIPGALIATLGVVLPSCVFVTILAHLYTKYRKLAMMQGILKTLRPTVVAMIFSAGLMILVPALFANSRIQFAGSNFQVRAFILFILALVLLRQKKLKKLGPISIMVLCGIIETVSQLLGA